jgi:hypothetical protein
MARAVGRPRAAGCAKHRAAQKRYVAKNPGKQRARVARHYQENASRIKAEKRKQRKADGGKGKAGAGGGGGGGQRKQGRPREC